MKTEQKQLLRLIEPFFVCFIFGCMYAMGGSADFGGLKWIRRFLAPGLFSIYAFIRTLDWRYLVQMPFCFGALSLPYGSDSFITKVFLRGIFGLANGISFNIRNLWRKKWVFLSISVIISVSCSILLGVFNPYPDNAIIEQFLIGIAIILIPSFTVQKE